MFIGFLFLLLTVVAFVLIVAVLFLGNLRRSDEEDTTPTTTRILLVALRIAIGWHLFVEGAKKIDDDYWSSAGYLRNATGPFASTFRDLAGDRLIEKLTLVDNKMSPALKAEWDVYYDAFKDHYGLNKEQVTKADDLFHKHETALLAWLRLGTEKVTVPSEQPPPLEVYMTMDERLKAYDERMQEVVRIEGDLPEFGTALFKKYITAKGQANQLRAGMQRDLAKRTADMKAALRSVLSGKEQLEKPTLENPWNELSNFSNWALLDWSDFIVKYGLAIAGACLIGGLFTRTFCVVGAAFLLTFFLAMPSLPWWPAPPQAEGTYLFINKNLIEMLALLMLASTLSGRWVGLDGLIHATWRWMFPREPQPKPAEPAPTKSEPKPQEGETPATPVADPSSKSEEIQHVS